MKINFFEGFYRIFVLLSFMTSIIVFLCSVSLFNSLWGAMFCGILAGILCYFMYFVIEWVIVGFNKDVEIVNTGLKDFIKRGVNKLINVNYAKPFFFILVMIIPLIVFNIDSAVKRVEYYDMNSQYNYLLEKIKRLEKDNEELTEALNSLNLELITSNGNCK